MRHAAMRGLFVVALLAAGVCGAAPEGAGRWLDLKTRGSEVAMDSGGQLWTLTEEGPRYWDGHRFAVPRLSEVKKTYKPGSAHICGRPLSGAFLLIPGDRENQGLAYRLNDGEVRFATEFYTSFGSFYPANNGVFVNYGLRFVATCRPDGEWRRIESKAPVYATVVEAGSHVVLVTDTWLYIIDTQGEIRELPMPSLPSAEPGAAPGVMPGVPESLEVQPGPRGTVSLNRYPSGGRGLFDPEQCCLLPAEPFPGWQEAGPRPFLTPNGSFRHATVDPSDLAPEWAEHRPWDPTGHLAASDGSLWTALNGSEVSRYKDGRLTRYGWRDGLLMGTVQRLLEGANGQVFACSWGDIFLFQPGAGPPPAPGLALWDSRRLVANSSVIRDSEGRLWMRPAEDTGALSVWDGKDWHEVKVPLGPRAEPGSLVMADDRGHVIATGYPDGRGSAAFDVSMTGVERYESRPGREPTNSLLEAVISKGVGGFTAPDGLPAVYGPREGRMGFGKEYYGDTSRLSNGSLNGAAVMESVRYGVLFGDMNVLKYTWYDRGQYLDVPAPAVGEPFLLGPRGFQPFEAALMAAHPGRFLPVVRTGARSFRLLRKAPSEARAEAAPLVSDLGDELPQYTRGTVAPMPPVHYLLKSGALAWELSGKVFSAEFSGTPLQGKNASIGQVLAGPGGRLWFIYSFSGATCAYGKRLDEFTVSVEAGDRREGALTLNVVLHEPGLEEGRGYVFWRINGGPYEGGGAPGAVEVRAGAREEYDIEVIGVDPQGCVTPRPYRYYYTTHPRWAAASGRNE
jgi:hypothetical protein